MACLKKEREICSKERCAQSLHANLPAAGTNERLEAGAALSASCFPAQGDHNGGHDGALSTCQEKKQPTKNTRVVVVHERVERGGIHSLPFCPMTKLTLGENVTSRRRWHMKSSKTSFSITPTSAWLCSARRRHVDARTKAIDYLQARSTYYVRSDTQTLVRFSTHISRTRLHTSLAPLASCCVESGESSTWLSSNHLSASGSNSSSESWL